MANDKQQPEEKWEPDHFSRRDYTISGDLLDNAKRIRVQVLVDGVKQIDFQLREPGMLCIVSRPDDEGISVELVEPAPQRATDMDDDETGKRRTPRPWQIAALLEPR
jgi:hypothetical protein